MRFAAWDVYVKLAGDLDCVLSAPQPEEQSSDYESGTVKIGSDTWRIRTARVTPKKPGAFVAVWKREAHGETRPFKREEYSAGLMVFVREAEKFGVFRFSTAQLAALGVLRSGDQEGKRGFRVYPSWSTGLNRQAAVTQRRQSPAFHRLDGAAGPESVARTATNWRGQRNEPDEECRDSR